MGYYSLWYVKIDLPQNMDLNTPLERPYKKLLNTLFSFENYFLKIVIGL